MSGRDLSGKRPLHRLIDFTASELESYQKGPAAIGGGTDAKGHVALVAAGSLFSLGFGPPVNFHGLNEGAPLEDLWLSARILYQIMLDEIADKPTR